MLDQISNQIGQISPELKVFLMAMLPIAELRLALPVALAFYHLPFAKAFGLSIAGNFILMPLLVYFLDWVDDFLGRRIKFFSQIFIWLKEHTRKKHSQKFEIWGALALIVFIAIPLPGTGAWTGAFVAYIFGFDKRKTLWYIFIGILGASIIVGATTLGLSKIL